MDKILFVVFPLLLCIFSTSLFFSKTKPSHNSQAPKLNPEILSHAKRSNVTPAKIQAEPKIQHNPFPHKITIIVLKQEQTLEVWGHHAQSKYLMKIYPFTAYSGKLGPKLKSGDRQIPEGLYGIEYLNPNSKFHLSMKLTYPNAFDQEMAKKDGRINLGGDIFIHGKDVTIGCIPIGDKNIEELFYLVKKIGLENVSVIVSPFDTRIIQKTLEISFLKWYPEKFKRIKLALSPFK